MRIREATAGDLEFIAAANSALSTETEGQDLDQGLLRPGIRAVLDDPTLGRYYLAEIDGRVVGQLMTTYEWSDSRICGIRLYVDHSNEPAQGAYSRLGMHRSNYRVMQTVYRGRESHEG